jgi:hypothetical protein
MGESEQTLDSRADVLEPHRPWKAGAYAGAIATVATTIAIAAMNVDIIDQIAGLYGLEGNMGAGAIIHLVHGTLFGALFAAVVSDPPIHPETGRWWLFPFAGFVYAVVLAFVGAGIIMPIWLGEVGYAGPAAEAPYVTTGTLIWHAVFGLMLGAVFQSLSDHEILTDSV